MIHKNLLFYNKFKADKYISVITNRLFQTKHKLSKNNGWLQIRTSKAPDHFHRGPTHEQG